MYCDLSFCNGIIVFRHVAACIWGRILIIWQPPLLFLLLTLLFQNRANLNLFRLQKDASHGGHAFSVDERASERGKKKAFRKGVAQEGGISMTSMGDAVDFLPEGEAVVTENMNIFDTSWNVGLVVALHDRPGSWTQRLCEAKIGTCLSSWGPYSTEYNKLSFRVQDLPPLVLIATGAGAAYIIDFVHWLSASSTALSEPVSVYFRYALSFPFCSCLI